ncbi:LysR substrate-binding domain-containing protein [Thauera sinica]|uniref:LysR substrate-binding domain-containing protein n=1 Tax=Thauera sinica TaxID=2665146 RepID=A0ABW1ALY2_9RHOO|nr:LysR substrate-binding domain-containing protein [Thauera sp. K11]ATE60882.1 LysR family transcriptional regulator [Thauera sp. K11]
MKLAQRVTLRQLRALAAVADSASFTQAARLLHLTQPAISMQIRDMEDIVGQVLVDGRREIHLTTAGEIVLRAAREALEGLERAEVELKARMGVAAGTLDVVAITTAEYFVPHLLAEFGRRHPDISFRLTVDNRERVHALLQENRVDVAIMGQPPRGLALRRIPFAPHRLSFVARPGHPLAARRNIPVAALAGERLLLREQGSGTRDNLERFLRANGVKPLAADQLGSNETLKQAAMAGMGIAFLSHHTFAMEVEYGRLQRLDLQDTPVIREWNVVARADRPLTPALEALLEFLQTEGAAMMRAMER